MVNTASVEDRRGHIDPCRKLSKCQGEMEIGRPTLQQAADDRPGLGTLQPVHVVQRQHAREPSNLDAVHEQVDAIVAVFEILARHPRLEDLQPGFGKGEQ